MHALFSKRPFLKIAIADNVTMKSFPARRHMQNQLAYYFFFLAWSAFSSATETGRFCWKLFSFRQKILHYADQIQQKGTFSFSFSWRGNKATRLVAQIEPDKYLHASWSMVGLIYKSECRMAKCVSLPRTCGACKNCSFRPQFLKKTNTVTTNNFLISGIVMKHRTDTEKISQFLGRIRTGSS